jgi:TPR repeat protein
MFDDSVGVERDQKKAFEWYHKAAEAGFVNAMKDVAMFLREGTG